MKLGDRIKRYEAVSHQTATGRTPLMIRVDGRAFHTLTRGMNRPFDIDFIDAMVSSATDVAMQMQGFKLAYIQSDEATFCITDYDRIESQGWFDYDLHKITSITAAIMSVRFTHHLHTDSFPVFDCRAFSVPANDVVNAFLWRAKDWERNSLQMYARAHFSHKQLHGQNRQAMHDMLHAAGKNWATDLSPQLRNGTYLVAGAGLIDRRCDVLPSFDALNAAFGPLFDMPAQVPA